MVWVWFINALILNRRREEYQSSIQNLVHPQTSPTQSIIALLISCCIQRFMKDKFIYKGAYVGAFNRNSASSGQLLA
jgi:hypothetical protein